MRVLVVDDDVVVRAYLRRVFQRVAWVELASSASEARELLEEQSFDVVVSDFSMPVEHGLSLLAWVARRFAHVRRVLFSALPPGELDDAMRAGIVQQFLAKPAGVDELLALVERGELRAIGA